MSNSMATISVVSGLLLTGLLVYMFYTTEMRKNKGDVKVKKDVVG